MIALHFATVLPKQFLEKPKKKATKVCHQGKHLVRGQTMEQLCVCIIKGLDIVRNIQTLLTIAAIKGRTIPW